MTANGNESQQMTMSDSEWQQVVQGIKMAQYTSKNGWLPFFLWQKQMHYFKGWMTAIRVLKKRMPLRSSKKIDGLNK